MINDNSLSNRLNEFKKKKSLPEDKSSVPKNSILSFLSGILSGALVILKTVVFGYSVKIIFNTDRNFISTICVGLAITFLMVFIFDLTDKS
jgi:hypothetical protein